MLGAMRMTRSVVSSPPVGGYVAWFDASNAASITSSAGAVSQWSDLSGNGNHISQSTGAAKPTTGSTTINGLNVITFDGGDFLDAASLSAAPNATTLFAVLRSTSTTTDRAVCGPTTSSGLEWRFDQTTNKQNMLKANTAGIGTSSSGVTNNAVALCVAQYVAASTYAFWLNTAATGSGSHSVTVSGGLLRIGAQAAGGNGSSEWWVGDLAEFIRYDSALGTTDRQSVESYLRTKWGTP